jgi:hypothetical protein
MLPCVRAKTSASVSLPPHGSGCSSVTRDLKRTKREEERCDIGATGIEAGNAEAVVSF